MAGQYIVGTPKAMLRPFEQHLLEKDWQEVQEGVEVKLVPGPDGTETFVLARSADRRKKEQAMHRRFVERLEAALMQMQAQAESGRLKDPARGQPAAGPADAAELARVGSVRGDDQAAARTRARRG